MTSVAGASGTRWPPRGSLAILVALALVVAGCTGADDDAAPPGEGPLVEQRIGPGGGVVTAADVTVTIPDDASESDLVVRVSTAADTEPYQSWGSVVEIEHDHRLDKPVVVEWDVSHLSEGEREVMVPLVLDEETGQWLVDDVRIEIDGTVAILEADQWSSRTWMALSQNLRELLGRGVDPPMCDGDRPGWVQAFVDPAENTSDAAPLLVCIESDPNNPDVVTMRIANNRPYSQFVLVDVDDPLAWVSMGQVPADASAILHHAIAAVLNDPDRVLVPPLHEIAIGVSRPSSPIRNQHVKFSSDVSLETFLVDVIGFVVAELPVERAFTDNKVIRALIEWAVRCGLSRVAELQDPDLHQAISALVGTVKTCIGELVNKRSELGQEFRSLADVTDDDAAKEVEIAAVAKYFKVLKVAEVLGYFIEVEFERYDWRTAFDDPVWSLSLDGRAREPGDWQATCTDAETDHRAWNQSWVPQPAFYVGETRDYHEYPEFDSILTEATAPLGQCSADHVRRVRELVEPSRDDAPETFDRILAIFDALIESLTDELVEGSGQCSPTAIAQAFGPEASVVNDRCVDGWAIVDLCDDEPCGDSWILAHYQAGAWSRVTGFPTGECRSHFEAMGAPGTVLDQVGWGPACREPSTTTTTTPPTTTTSATSSPATTTDPYTVLQRFIDAWNAQDWVAMAAVADSQSVDLARNSAVPGGQVLPGPPRGRCIALGFDHLDCELAYGTTGQSTLFDLDLDTQVRQMEPIG